MSRADRRRWVWLPRRIRFRVLGLVDLVTLWTLVAVLAGGGAWWGVDTYRDHRDYCTQNHDLRRMDPTGECIGVTAEAYPFSPDLADVMGRIEQQNKAAADSGKPVVSVAVVMPYTSETPGAAMSATLIRHSLEGAYVGQRRNNDGADTGDTAIQLLFANVGEDLTYWQTVTDELAARRDGDKPVVAAIGLPNSDSATLAAVKKGLAHSEIPAVSAVLSSPDMENPFLLKVSPSTEQLADALKRYVSANDVDRKNTFLIADERDDNYVSNLRHVFYDQFGERYGITNDKVNRRVETYIGKKGPPNGGVDIFRRAVAAMCQVGTNTVFVAGRDADLPPLLRTIDRTRTCDRDPDGPPMRILRVSTGRDPVTETTEMRRIAERNNLEVVTAAAVDAPRWREAKRGDEQVPKAFGEFADSYEQYFGKEKGDSLNDGYAVMYHDALTAVGTAVAAARDSDLEPVDHNDVYSELRRGSPLAGCVGGCVPGASGIFTFVNENSGMDGGTAHEAATGLWPVCKPVPVVTFPKARHSKSPLYRTYEKAGESTCPKP